MDPITCIKTSTRPHCASAGQLMASIVDRRVGNVTYREVYDFYNLNGCLEPGTSISRAVGFYDEWVANVTGAKIKNLHDTIVKESDCRLQFCKNLNFTGNADFAGIGVLVSFCIQISIATAFATYALYRIFNRKTLGTPWVSFRNTFYTFFTSSVFVNVAIALAAASSIGIEDRTEHTAVFTTLGFLLSLASTQALWSLYRLYNETSEVKQTESTEVISTGTTEVRSTKATEVQSTNTTEVKPIETKASTATSLWSKIATETHLIQLCLGLLWIVMLVLCAVIIKVKWKTSFEVFCFHRLNSRPVATGLLYAPIGLAFLVIVCAVLKKIFPGEKDSEWKPWGWVDPVVVFMGLVLMWLAFGVLWVLRTQLGTVAGITYRDNDWGFGQVAAVAAWLPTVVEIVRDTYQLTAVKVPEKKKDGAQEAGNVVTVQV